MKSVILLQSSASRIYLNVTTMESKDFTVALTGEGFRVVAEGKHDSVDEENHMRASTSEGSAFETPYSLLGSISPGFRFVNVIELPGEILGLNLQRNTFYRDAFGRRLSFKLEEVFKSQQKEEEAQQS